MAQTADRNKHRELESFCPVGRALNCSTPAGLCHVGNTSLVFADPYFSREVKNPGDLRSQVLNGGN